MMLTTRATPILMILTTVTVAVSGCGDQAPGGITHTGGTGGANDGVVADAGTGGGRAGTGGVGGACAPQDAGVRMDADDDASQGATVDATAAFDSSTSDDVRAEGCPAMIVVGETCSVEGLQCYPIGCHTCTGGSGYIRGSRICSCSGGRWGCRNVNNDCIGFDRCDNDHARDPTFYFRDSACTVPFCAGTGDAACQ
jgi:hypothetical protein